MHLDKFPYNKNELDALISQIYLGTKLYTFRTVPPSIIRNFSLYTQQWYMSYRFADSFQAGSCPQTCMTYTIAECTVKNSWWWTEELSETCRVSFPNKFEKLVHLVGFIIRKLIRYVSQIWQSPVSFVWCGLFFWGEYIIPWTGRRGRFTLEYISSYPCS
jgi:hypothetical protein